MPPIDIRPAEPFPEPEFTRLKRIVFADLEQSSDALASALQQESASAPAVPPAHVPIYRLGAYAGEELVGWSYGWMERGRVFYMAHSGVMPSHRRQGLYRALIDAIRAHAVSEGAVALRSQHSVVNNPVIIAKLRAGFHVSGLSQSAHMGLLVELTQHLYEQRRDLYRVRSLPYGVPQA